MTCRNATITILVVGLALPGCESGGHFTFLGYTTRPNYDTCIKTIYVPIFQCDILLDETRRQIPFDLTRAVIREIEAKTPYKVVSDRGHADTDGRPGAGRAGDLPQRRLQGPLTQGGAP